MNIRKNYCTHQMMNKTIIIIKLVTKPRGCQLQLLSSGSHFLLTLVKQKQRQKHWCWGAAAAVVNEKAPLASKRDRFPNTSLLPRTPQMLPSPTSVTKQGNLQLYFLLKICVIMAADLWHTGIFFCFLTCLVTLLSFSISDISRNSLFFKPSSQHKFVETCCSFPVL